MKKLIAIVLVLAMSLLALASCGGGDDAASAQDKSTVLEKYGLTDQEFTDYKGYEFRILTNGSTGGEHWSAFEFLYDKELQGDALNEAVKTRDNDVGAIHNIKISYLEKNPVTDFARDSILSGSDDFDLIADSLNGSAVLASESMLANLMDYDDVLNLEAEYWDQRANESLSIDGHLYFTCSDLTLLDKQATWVVFFTKSMITKYPDLTAGYENGLYSMVDQGKWTIEAMYNMCKAVTADKDGDGVETNADSFGHFGEAFNTYAFMVGCGAAGVDKNAAGELEYVLDRNVDDLVLSYNHISDIMSNFTMSSGEMLNYVTDVWVDGAGSLMEKNQLLFNVTGMNRCRLFRNLEADFGIIPMPKANEAQEDYHMPMTGAANGVSVPINGKDKVRTCEILETLTNIGSKTTYHAYIEQSLKSKYLRDDDSEAMLDIIFNNRRFDLADIYKYNNAHFGPIRIFYESSAPSKEGLASSLKKTQTRNTKALERLIEDMQEVFEKTKRS